MIPVSVAVLLPFLGAIGVVAIRKYRGLRNLLLILTGIVNLAVISHVALHLSRYPHIEVLFETLPGLAIAFHVEPLGLIFALTAGILWPITSIYSISYLNACQDVHQTRFHALFCVAVGSAMGIAFAENLFTLFLFYEMLTFSTWPLVTHSRTRESVSAGRVYLGVLLASSLLLFLLAIVLVGNYGSGLSFVPGGQLASASPALVAVLLVLFIFGIGKAAVMPLHRWLPKAMVAPAPVSALLHAVAVVKAGVFSILKITVYIFGFDLLNNISLRDVLIWIPAATVLVASFIAMKQDDIKARLAYSTVSQLSYIVTGALMANSLALVGSGMHIVMHAFGKITLFFCAGAIMICSGKKYISDMNGLGRSMPWTFGAFFVTSLSIAGLPPTGGMWSKWYLALGALEMGQIAILVVLMLSSLMNVYYLLAVPLRAFFLPAPNPPARLEGRPTLIAPLVLTALLSLALFFLSGNLQGLLTDFAGRMGSS